MGAEVTPAALDILEARTRESRFVLVPGDERSPVPPLQDEVLGIIVALRAAWAERDALRDRLAALSTAALDLAGSLAECPCCGRSDACEADCLYAPEMGEDPRTVAPVLTRARAVLRLIDGAGKGAQP